MDRKKYRKQEQIGISRKDRRKQEMPRIRKTKEIEYEEYIEDKDYKIVMGDRGLKEVYYQRQVITKGKGCKNNQS